MEPQNPQLSDADRLKAADAVVTDPAKRAENHREIDTRLNANVPVSELKFHADMGFPTEVSGDALARATEGQKAKLHTSDNDTAHKSLDQRAEEAGMSRFDTRMQEGKNMKTAKTLRSAKIAKAKKNGR